MKEKNSKEKEPAEKQQAKIPPETVAKSARKAPEGGSDFPQTHGEHRR